MYQIKSANEVKKELGVCSAKHLGYVVHLEETDEFLASYSSSGVVNHYAWAITPELALVFTSVRKAINVAIEKDGAIVCYLFELDKQYAVAPIQRIYG